MALVAPDSAFCLDILERHVPETFRYRVFTEVTNRLFIDRSNRESGLTPCPVMSAKVTHLRRYQDSKLYQFDVSSRALIAVRRSAAVQRSAPTQRRAEG